MASAAAAAASAAAAAAAAVLLALSLLSAADARPGLHFHPCKTLFVSYTFSSSSSSSSDSAVLSLPQIATEQKPSGTFVVYRVVRRLRPHYYSAASFPEPRRQIRIERPQEAASTSPSDLDFVLSSFQERAKDILFVLAGLLFGVGCGALTAVIVYLAWSLLTNRRDMCGSDEYSDDSEEDEVDSPKKMGYVTISGVEAPAKEGYEGK